MILKATINELTAFEADELSLFNEKINKKIAAVPFLICNESNDTKINDRSINEIEKNVKISCGKINDLLKYRDAIKRTLALSNAITKVIIAEGEIPAEGEMPTAEAIGRRRTITKVMYM